MPVGLMRGRKRESDRVGGCERGNEWRVSDTSENGVVLLSRARTAVSRGHGRDDRQDGKRCALQHWPARVSWVRVAGRRDDGTSQRKSIY